ncbi:MAG: glycosyltransferase family 39 protein [Candidatus Rokubacteria bacterium]|nr:glycosyltransferase family 39 protein [Candidatus Rokubacteria bacterium]
MRSGDWITLHVDGVRYFDKPPLPYWLMASVFHAAAPEPFAARLVPALAAVACASLTAWLGVRLGGARVGLIAGLMTAANLGFFLYGRIVKPDTLFILCLFLAWAGFVLAWFGRGRLVLALFWAGLGLAAIAKDVVGALAPLAIAALFFGLVGERRWRDFVPWWGLGVFAVLALPWHLLVERRNPGFFWYTIVDNHLLNFMRQRRFPDEDVTLGALEFLAVTAAAFLPWLLAVPWAVGQAFRDRHGLATERLWALFALWPLVLVAFFTLSPFKLPHYGLPAVPALALLAARTWDASIARAPDAPGPRALLVPIVVLFAAGAVALAAAWAGALPLPDDVLDAVDLASRNRAAQGLGSGPSPFVTWRPVIGTTALLLGGGALALAVAAWRRAGSAGVALALAVVLGFLPLAGRGMADFARLRSVAPLAAGLATRVHPGEVVAHEGPIENAASLLLTLRAPLRIVDGLQSNLAFGATFAEARDVFWDGARLRAAWTGAARCYLVTSRGPEGSVTATLPPERLHLLARNGTRRLYSNLAD